MTNWLKQITAPATTTTDIFAGDVLNWVIQYHNDVDLASGDPSGIAKILTETIFNSGKLKFYDSDKSNEIAITTPDWSEDKTASFPTTWATSDEIVGRTTSMTLTGKSVDATANALSNIGDTAIATHTSTKISITNKSQLNTAIAYTDQTNTYGDFSSIFRATRVKIRNPANTFSYTIVGGAIGADRNVNLPALGADDNFVFEAFAQTLLNKTLTSPTIGTTLTLSDATNIVAGTTTGTKIGTATTQKIGFYNATPIVQGASIADISTSATGTQISVAVNAIITRLEQLGLIATV